MIGEVAGQGIHAAATMGQVRTAVQTLAALDLEPDELLARLNDTATSLARERAALPADDPLRRQPLTATCVYAVYDPLDRTCSLARAGHSPPALVHPDGTTEILDLPNGPPLGSADGAPFAKTTLSLAQGSVLALYTTSLVSPFRPTGQPTWTPSGGCWSPASSPCRTSATPSSNGWTAVPPPAMQSSYLPVPATSPPIRSPPGTSTAGPKP
ncbi:PP2C family protein-serine/threonine phosphatase [Streptomyces sp. NBC_00649]|uniref:PP2C family protein-serine/threonine phosphatase n=1 Tax=Streptomyces sp. NBC_00649 TaxID=2975798 RepID=UPI00225C1CE2|nr:PP2C family protein-serine/threonine phosphatase [Streptomyces sp. NBC_00063]MCX5442816.1 serine/threonine-protein phosphatase [Streptomyces sp. NBC_00063]